MRRSEVRHDAMFPDKIASIKVSDFGHGVTVCPLAVAGVVYGVESLYPRGGRLVKWSVVGREMHEQI